MHLQLHPTQAHWFHHHWHSSQWCQDQDHPCKGPPLCLNAHREAPAFNLYFNYQLSIGKLNYLAQTTCPGIMYGTHQIAKYSANLVWLKSNFFIVDFRHAGKMLVRHCSINLGKLAIAFLNLVVNSHEFGFLVINNLISATFSCLLSNILHC